MDHRREKVPFPLILLPISNLFLNINHPHTTSRTSPSHSHHSSIITILRCLDPAPQTAPPLVLFCTSPRHHGTAHPQFQG